MIAKSHQVRVGEQSFNVFPSQPETVQALWAALPPDLRLALAKACPPIARPWMTYDDGDVIRWDGDYFAATISPKDGAFDAGLGTAFRTELGTFPTLAEAQAACDAALIAQGYVLDGETQPEGLENDL